MRVGVCCGKGWSGMAALARALATRNGFCDGMGSFLVACTTACTFAHLPFSIFPIPAIASPSPAHPHRVAPSSVLASSLSAPLGFLNLICPLHSTCPLTPDVSQYTGVGASLLSLVAIADQPLRLASPLSSLSASLDP